MENVVVTEMVVVGDVDETDKLHGVGKRCVLHSGPLC